MMTKWQSQDYDEGYDAGYTKATKDAEKRHGQCRRGHEGEFYLNKNGYCSPSCELGFKREKK